jgi:proteic killer suppression protein
MIKSFKHKGLKHFFENDDLSGIQSKHASRLKLILDLLDMAAIINDVNFPGSRLHPLEPKKDKIWSVTVSGNWRVIFKFENSNVYIVDYKDYH